MQYNKNHNKENYKDYKKLLEDIKNNNFNIDTTLTEVRVTLLNIKNFMKFNNDYGHDEGDKVIEYINTKLINTISNKDIITKPSGNEWLIISFDDKYYKIDDFNITLDNKNKSSTIKVMSISGKSYFSNILNLIRELDKCMYHYKFYSIKIN